MLRVTGTLRAVIVPMLLCLWLASCRPGSLPAVTLPQIAALGGPALSSATRTPFQAIPPTPRPTLTPAPTATLTSTPLSTATVEPCAAAPGRIEQAQETFSGAPFFFRVYLPPCFDQRQDARYPVLYMIHGQTYNDDQWERLGIAGAADALIHTGEAAPFLIVMPREPDTFADIYVSSFNRDVIDGLIPWVDSHYPACTERACRAIGGLSRGGAWALHLGFTHWELFGAIGLHSTPPFNTDPGLFPSWVSRIPPEQMPRVYMDAGRRDGYLSMASAFEAELVRYGVAHEWYIFNGAHNEEYWSAHVADYLAWYTQNWK